MYDVPNIGPFASHVLEYTRNNTWSEVCMKYQETKYDYYIKLK